jgi:uncharacterized protein (TIGR02453 family)
MSDSSISSPRFPKEGIALLSALAKNNRREWFLEHKAQFERDVKAPMLALVDAVNDALRKSAPAYVTDAKRSLMRMNRDVRFSKDKSPYRTDVAARFGRGGGKAAEAGGFYVSVSPRGVDVAAGSHALEPEPLAALRRRIARDPDAFRAFVTDRRLLEAFGPLKGERLVRVPKDFPSDHPAGDLLRLKEAYFYVTLPASLATSPDLAEEVTRRVRLGVPFVEWIARAIDRG